ncbi:hypothetical protein ACH5RR_035535 [Cinchona calisaya]|uniref:CCHC-type domain-containing protein n=1 Tax=Cinchona calisaya TaxID=153742 RepID=A0ABD2Y2X0_9GENT
MLKFEEGLQSRFRTMIATGCYPTCEDMYDAALRAERDLIWRESEFKQNRHRHVTTQTAKLPGPPRTTFKGRGVSSFSTYVANKPKACDHCHRVHPGECRWKSGACFGCGQSGHKVKDCPQTTSNNSRPAKPGNNKSNPNSKIYAMTDQEVEGADNVVTAQGEPTAQKFDSKEHNSTQLGSPADNFSL